MSDRGQRTLLGNDVLLSVVFEMIRIYTHPFLAGCSEQACCECSCGSVEWADSRSVDDSVHIATSNSSANFNPPSTTNTASPKSQDWNKVFCQCSGKILMLDFLVNCLFQVTLIQFTNLQDSTCQVLGIYSRSLRMCQYLTQYYRNKCTRVQWYVVSVRCHLVSMVFTHCKNSNRLSGRSI